MGAVPMLGALQGDPCCRLPFLGQGGAGSCGLLCWSSTGVVAHRERHWAFGEAVA